MIFNQRDRRPVKLNGIMYTNSDGKTTIYNYPGGDFVVTKYVNIIKKRALQHKLIRIRIQEKNLQKQNSDLVFIQQDI